MPAKKAAAYSAASLITGWMSSHSGGRPAGLAVISFLDVHAHYHGQGGYQREGQQAKQYQDAAVGRLGSF